MMLGDQTVVISTVSSSGSPGYLGLTTESRTNTTVTGCRARVLSSTETAELQVDVTTEIWKFTMPPVAAASGADARDEIVYDGTSSPTRTTGTVFQLYGPPQLKVDLDGTLHHVTLMAKRQAG